MNKRVVIFNLSTAIAILFSILFQSADSFGHLAQQFSEKKCVHKHHAGLEITHQHHNFDHCFVCEFAFNNFISPDSYYFKLRIAQKAIPYFFTTSETPESFSGSCCSLRGPPKFIV